MLIQVTCHRFCEATSLLVESVPSLWPIYDAFAPVVHRETTTFAIHPPIRPQTRPNTEATHRPSPMATTQNTTLESGHAAAVPPVAVLTTVTIREHTPRTPPRKPARSPAAAGSVTRTAAMAPAMNAPSTMTPPPMVASEFGSRLSTAATGSEASAPTSANRHADGTVWKSDGDIRI